MSPTASKMWARMGSPTAALSASRALSRTNRSCRPDCTCEFSTDGGGDSFLAPDAKVMELSAVYSRQFENTDVLRRAVPSACVSRNSELWGRSTMRLPMSTLQYIVLSDI